jgi:hypothetical protein
MNAALAKAVKGGALDEEAKVRVSFVVRTIASGRAGRGSGAGRLFIGRAYLQRNQGRMANVWIQLV